MSLKIELTEVSFVFEGPIDSIYQCPLLLTWFNFNSGMDK